MKRSDKRCGWCCHTKAWFKGIPIFSQDLANIQHRITRIVTRICKGKEYNAFYVSCLYDGCKSDSRYVNRENPSAARKKFCIAHRVIVFRMAAYRHLYKTLKAGISRDRNQNKALMSFEEFVLRCKEKICFYCGDSVVRSKYNVRNGNFRSSLDKKDPTKGYIFNNTVTCCTFCNYTKGYLLTKEEMLLVGLVRKQKAEEAFRYLSEMNLKRNSEVVDRVHRSLFYKIHPSLRG